MLTRLSLLAPALTRTLKPTPTSLRHYSAMSLPTSMRACSIQSQGDLDVIEVREVEVPKVGDGEVLIKVEYAGEWG